MPCWPRMCAQPCVITKKLKESMASRAYFAQPCISGRKFTADMHGHVFHPKTTCTASLLSAQTVRINSVFQTVLIHS